MPERGGRLHPGAGNGPHSRLGKRVEVVEHQALRSGQVPGLIFGRGARIDQQRVLACVERLV
ncbi:MAG: hypothetical protein ABIK62_03900, partial [candidate division WOR-3 bacterium]